MERRLIRVVTHELMCRHTWTYAEVAVSVGRWTEDEQRQAETEEKKENNHLTQTKKPKLVILHPIFTYQKNECVVDFFVCNVRYLYLGETAPILRSVRKPNCLSKSVTALRKLTETIKIQNLIDERPR